MAKIELNGIRKTFEGNEILKGIDLAIDDGEFIALIGPSGCGKSTLLRIIAGLETQNAGNVRIDGAVVDGIRPNARNLAMVFQSYALYPHLTVYDNIAVPLRMRRLTSLQRFPLLGQLFPERHRIERSIRDDVERVAAQLEITTLLKRKPGQLSGGQRQRVAVGRSIVRDPVGFLFDEPLSNLDAKLRVHMRAEIAQLHRQMQSTFIYVTHDQAEAMTMSNRIAVMIAGHIVQIGAPADVYENPRDLRVAEFVGSPKINVLPGSVGSDGALDALGQRLGLTTSAPTGRCSIGVRPERIRLGDGSFVGDVVHIENLGAEAFVHIKHEAIDLPVVARIDHNRLLPAIGSKIAFSFTPDAVLAFDAQGRRIDTRQQAQREKMLEVALG
ncbi:ABC transporter ATP-binding protein [Rhodopseudomonas boonkerdii]|uniref:ABC transporter ATP-binding protein n=1 Tax=Rhodopseudomonas boonkerdii TaxID=475937 RepID=UPI001E400810|nr:ABC transporter ATP-binding protein [Rhodopseudomonas boonkerdii]UGV27349.1 ABC transporter ATP-binding protein [Rhodopseudomonas boonkerdii]